MTYTPLTPEQFQAAQKAGFNTDQIIANEEKRKNESVAQVPQKGLLQKVGGFLGNATGVSGLIKEISGKAEPIFKTGGLVNQQTGKIQQPFNVSGLKQAVGTGAKLGFNAALLGGAGASSIPIQAGIGGGLSAANSLEQGQNPSLKSVAGGAALGGALPILGKGLGYTKESLTKVLPKSIIRSYIPAEKDIAQHVLEKTKLGFTRTMLKDAEENVKSLSGNIKDILKTKYAGHLGNGSDAVKQTLERFPESEYTVGSVTKTLKSLVPEKSKLVDKVINGIATLDEKDTLRSALDRSVQSVYSKLSVPPAKKQLGATFAGALREEVQGIAQETAPLFDELSKEINVRNALNKSTKKFGKVNLRDILTFMTAAGTTAAHNPVMAIPAAFGAVGAERIASSPAFATGIAKGLYNAGKREIPQSVKNAGKIGVLNSLTRRSKPTQ